MSDFRDLLSLKGDTVTRTYRILRIEPHVKRKALLIHGEVNVQIANSLSRVGILHETKQFRKMIRLDSLNDLTDISGLAEDILDSCPFIDEEQLLHLHAVLDVIRSRKYNKNGFALPSSRNSTDDMSTPTFPDYDEDELNGIDSDTDLKDVSMDSLEHYVELLYEQLQGKVEGARCIAKLASIPENLSEICETETYVNALFRTLREDYKKSMDLTTYILMISFSLATYRSFHQVFIKHKICSLLMDIVEYEITRHDKWVDEIVKRKESANNPQSSTKTKLEYDRMTAKFTELTTRQDVLLCHGFQVIRLLSESPAFMQEIGKRGIVKLLINCLDRKESIDLVTTALSFLKVLSTFREATSLMASWQIIDILDKVFDENYPKSLLAPLLGLLFNLSFSSKLRQKMLKSNPSILSKTASLLDDDELKDFCIPLLYNLSMDERIRQKFAGTGALGSILKQITKSSDEFLSVEAKALTLNLASSKRCCQIICGNNGLPILLTLAFNDEDTLIMKIIRKLAQHEGPTKDAFVDLVSDIAGAIPRASSREFAIECMGTLGDLAIPELDFKRLLQQFKLVPWLENKIPEKPPRRQPPGERRSIEEIQLLETIIFIGTCAGDCDCACYLIQEDILTPVFNLCRTPSIDPELKLQILYMFYKFCCHDQTRHHIANNTDIPKLVIKCLHDDWIGIREMAEAVLNTFTLEPGERWNEQVKLEKFRAHNKAWIDVVKGPGGETPKSNLLPAYQKQQLEMFHPELELYEDELEHPGSGRSKESSSSTSDSQTVSETETEDESEDEDAIQSEGRLPPTELVIQQGIPVHPSKSIFDRFEHQFMQERGVVQDRYEYGISEDDDEGVDDPLGNGSLEDFKLINANPYNPPTYRNKSAKTPQGDYQQRKSGENGKVQQSSTNKTEDYNPSRSRNPRSSPLVSVEIKRKS